MDRHERTQDPVEAVKTAIEGKQAEIWTALPGFVESFNSEAMTVSVQPAIKGSMEDEKGQSSEVNLPLLVDVPVVFPSGGGFTLTHPIKKDDECLVIFASRCIDGWWDQGKISPAIDMRMHDLSDGFCIVGPRSQVGKLNPPVDAENVQLRTDDGEAHITMMSDYTIEAENPTAKITLSPDGEISATADKEINLKAPKINMAANSYSMTSLDGAQANASINANINQEGFHKSSGDQIAGSISQINHLHSGVVSGFSTTQKPVK